MNDPDEAPFEATTPPPEPPPAPPADPVPPRGEPQDFASRLARLRSGGPVTANHRKGPSVPLRNLSEHPARCPKCKDRRYVVLTPEFSSLAPIAMPCSVCNPVAFRRWEEGHLDTSHRRGDCPECLAVDQGRLHDFDFDSTGHLRPGVLETV